MVLLRTDVNDDIPLALPFENDSLLQRFLSVPQNEFDRLSAEIEATLRSLQLPHATGVDLNTIGWERGPLGLRRGRGDDAYRQYLHALPNAFGCQHRRKDVRTAIASGVVADEEDDVVLDEDVTTNTYSVTLRSWQGHDVSLVDFLADYADAPVVTRTGGITYDRGTGPARKRGRGANTASTFDHGAGPPRVGDTGGMSAITEYEDGFGGFDFDDGYRFDVEEPGSGGGDPGPDPGQDNLSAIGVGEVQRVDSGESQTVDSPFDHDGTLNHDGTVNHD